MNENRIYARTLSARYIEAENPTERFEHLYAEAAAMGGWVGAAVVDA